MWSFSTDDEGHVYIVAKATTADRGSATTSRILEPGQPSRNLTYAELIAAEDGVLRFEPDDTVYIASKEPP